MQASVNDQKDGQENLTTTAILVNVIAVTARLIWSLYDRNDGLRRSPCSQSWFRRLCAGGIQPVVLYLDTFPSMATSGLYGTAYAVSTQRALLSCRFRPLWLKKECNYEK